MGLRDRLRAPRDRGKDQSRTFDHATYNRYLSDRGDRPSKDDETFTVNPSRPSTAREQAIHDLPMPDQRDGAKSTLDQRIAAKKAKSSNGSTQGSYISARPYTRPDEDNF